MRFLSRLYRIVSSVGFGITTLVLMALVMAFATKFESNTSTHLAQVYIYRSWWFDLLLLLFTISLSTATWNLRPFRLRHTGVLIIHSSLLIIMAGAFVTRRIGYEGTLRIQEGQSVSQITLRDMVLAIYDAETEQLQETIDTDFRSMASREFLNRTFTTQGGTELRVDRFYTDARSTESIVGGGNRDNPALHFQFSSAFFEEESWLFSREPGRDRLSFGELLSFRVQEFGNEQIWRELLSGAARTRPASLSLEFNGRSHQLEARPGQVQSLGEGYELEVLQTFESFSIGTGGQYRDLGGGRNNPAIEYVIRKGELEDHYVSFTLMPDFDPLHGQEAVLPATVSKPRYTPSEQAGELKNKEVLFALLADGIEVAWLDPEGQVAHHPVEVGGAALTLPWMGFQLSVDKFFPRAWIREDMLNAGHNNSNPAIRLNVHEDGGERQEWLAYGQVKSFRFEGKRWMIGFFPRQVPLGFTVHLNDFIEDKYPGSSMAMAYASQVTVHDHDEDAPPEWAHRDVEISMNNPLVYSGFKIFQSSFERPRTEGGPEVTILSVNRDPGDEIVYFGSLTLCIGLIVVFGFKKKLVEIERARRARQSA